MRPYSGCIAVLGWNSLLDLTCEKDPHDSQSFGCWPITCYWTDMYAYAVKERFMMNISKLGDLGPGWVQLASWAKLISGDHLF